MADYVYQDKYVSDRLVTSTQTTEYSLGDSETETKEKRHKIKIKCTSAEKTGTNTWYNYTFSFIGPHIAGDNFSISGVSFPSGFINDWMTDWSFYGSSGSDPKTSNFWTTTPSQLKLFGSYNVVSKGYFAFSFTPEEYTELSTIYIGIPITYLRNIGTNDDSTYFHDDAAMQGGFSLYDMKGYKGWGAFFEVSDNAFYIAGTDTWAETHHEETDYTAKTVGNLRAMLGVKPAFSLALSDTNPVKIMKQTRYYNYTRNGNSFTDYFWKEEMGSQDEYQTISRTNLVENDLYVGQVETSDSYTFHAITSWLDSDGKTIALNVPASEVANIDADNPYDDSRVKKAYQAGDTISLTSIARHKMLVNFKFSDGDKSVRADLVERNDPEVHGTATLTVKEDGVEKTYTNQSVTFKEGVAYTDATLTVSYDFKYATVSAYTTAIEITERMPAAIEIKNQNLNAYMGVAYDFGENAMARLPFGDGNYLTDPDGVDTDDDGWASVSSWVSAGYLVYSDIVDGNTISGDSNHRNVKVYDKWGNSYSFAVAYTYADGFALSNTDLGVYYLTEGIATNLRNEGKFGTVTAKYTLHQNTNDGTNETSTTTEIDVPNSELSCSDAESVGATTSQSSRSFAFLYKPSNIGTDLLAYASANLVVIEAQSLSLRFYGNGEYFQDSELNKFKKPAFGDSSKGLVAKVVWNDTSKAETELTSNEYATIKFYKSSAMDDGSLLTDGTTLLDKNQSEIYVKATVSKYGAGSLDENEKKEVTGKYSISGDYKANPVASVALGNDPSFTLGNYLKNFKSNITIIATMADGSTKMLASDDYSFASSAEGAEEKVIMASSDLDNVYVKVGSSVLILDKGSHAFSITVPTGSMEISNLRKTYVAQADRVDMTKVRATITYANTEASYTTKTIEMDSGNVASTTSYSVSCDDTSINHFDGRLSFTLSSGVKETKKFTFKALNSFDGKTEIMDIETVEVVSINDLTIKNISVTNIKAQYYVGEKFLGEGDPTTLKITYVRTDGNGYEYIDVPLSESDSIVGVEPAIGTLLTKANDSMTVNVRLYNDNTKYTSYITRVVSASTSANESVLELSAVFVPSSTKTGIDAIDNDENAAFYYDPSYSDPVLTKGHYVLVRNDWTEIDATTGARKMKDGYSVIAYGYLTDIMDSSNSAKVILFDDYKPSVQGQSNIEVKFPCHVKGNADKVNKCRVAKLFGTSNAKNRLFVSGNPDYPNCDWHTGAPNAYLQRGETMDSNGDFSYFGDMDYCFYGQTDNAVIGYDTVSTDKMVVLKSKSKVEPTNYFRASNLTQAMDASGNFVKGIDGNGLYMESFPLYTGNIGAGAMNMRAIANLNGDTLYVSSGNEICGLDIEGQVGDSQRISNSRSRYIDPELKGLDLSDCVLWASGKELYLFTDSATYMTNCDSLSSETMQYEWWKTDIKGVRCALAVDNGILYGNANGSLYRIGEEEPFYDCDKIFLNYGSALYVTLSTNFSDNEIAYNSALNDSIDPNATYTFTMLAKSLDLALFRKVASVSSTLEEGTDLYVDAEKNALRLVALGKGGIVDNDRFETVQDDLAGERKVYLNKAEGMSSIQGQTPFNEYYRAYTLKPVNRSDEYNEYALCDSDGNELQLTTKDGNGNTIALLTKADICEAMDGVYDVVNLDKGNCTFQLSKNGRVCDIVWYANQDYIAQTFKSELHKHTPVKAYFITAPATLGGLPYRKTVWSWTVSAFQEPNDLEVCEAMNEKNLSDMSALAFADKTPIGNDFNGVAFKNVDFGKCVVPRKYTYIRPLSVPFMAFGFRSGSAANSILTAVSIVYTVPVMGRGKF